MLGNIDSAEWIWKRFREVNPGRSTIAINDQLLSDAHYRRCMLKYNNRYMDGNLSELLSIPAEALHYKPDSAASIGLIAKVYFLAGSRHSAILAS